MNIKNLIMWVIIVVLSVGLFNMFQDPNKIDTQKNSLIATLSVPDKRITQLSGRIIREINEESYQYDRKSKLIKEISKLELNDIIQFYQEYIIENKNYIEIHNQKND